MRTITVGKAGNRAAATAAVLTALAPIAIVPHIVEDAAADAFQRFGVSVDAGALFIGTVLAVQILCAFGSLRHHRWGYWGVFAFAAVWSAGAALDHWGAFLPGTFRAGLSSRLLVWGIVLVQGAAALSAFRALRATRQTSFRGTGDFNV